MCSHFFFLFFQRAGSCSFFSVFPSFFTSHGIMDLHVDAKRKASESEAPKSKRSKTDESAPAKDDQPDLPTLDPSSMTYKELQKACKERGIRAQGKTEVLRERLAHYLKDPAAAEAAMKAEAEEKNEQKKEAKKKWVEWKDHPAREILRDDLERNGWLYGQDDLDGKFVYQAYMQQQPEFFKSVPLDQFIDQYQKATKRAAKRREKSAKEEEWLKHDRLIHPRNTHNARGEPVFDMDEEAKETLRFDVKYGLHETMEPMELHQYRPVYGKYKLDIFRPRIYQEIRRNKFINWLEFKRTEKRRKHLESQEITSENEQEITFENEQT